MLPDNQSLTNDGFIAKQIALANTPYTSKVTIKPLPTQLGLLTPNPNFKGSALPSELAKAYGEPPKRNRWG